MISVRGLNSKPPFTFLTQNVLAAAATAFDFAQRPKFFGFERAHLHHMDPDPSEPAVKRSVFLPFFRPPQLLYMSSCSMHLLYISWP